MDVMQTSLLAVIFWLLIYLPRKRRQAALGRVLHMKKMSRQKKEGASVRALAQQFMGKDVYIKLIEGTADGVLKEITGSGLMLENKYGIQAVNLDYILKIREYPYKNGKRATLWGE